MMQETAIVIVNWNKKDFLLKLLSKVEKISESADIIVVDNASTDGSVVAVKNIFPQVFLVENKVNTGGSGGFNSGIKRALAQNKYEYIWLLDNDADIFCDTLNGLRRVLYEHKDVGIAGSTMCYPDIPDLVVEQGGMVDWKSGLWKACHMNTRLSELTAETIDVDYVAACSMLIRVEILEETGLFDEKMFVHWDDVDFCLKCKEQGYRVVATKRSVVLHHGEQESPPDFLYYNFRNSLRVMSRHLKGLTKISAIYGQLRRMLKGKYLAAFLGDKVAWKIISKSYTDFNAGRFYKIDKSIKHFTNQKSEEYFSNFDEFRNYLILPYGSTWEILRCVNTLYEISSSNKLEILLQDYRAKFLLLQSGFDDFIISPGERGSLFSNILTLIRLGFSKYEIAVSSTRQILVPLYSLVFKRTIAYDAEQNKFFCLKNNRSDLWKLIPSFLLGETEALILLPKTLYAAKKVRLQKG